ncbi:MAG: ATP-binding protein [Planctomycetota bacterium]
MKELVVISGKGGTGKTSLVASFAALARPIVVADCDVDAADLHLVLSPEIRRRESFSGGKQARIRPEACTGCGQCERLCRFDAIGHGGVGNAVTARTYRIDPIACEGCGVCAWFCPARAIDFGPVVNGEWFVSDTRCGPMVHARLGIAQENSGKLVHTVRTAARELAETQRSEWLLVDGSPGTGCPVIASITGADLVLIVTEPTLSGLHDLDRVAQLTHHFDIPAMVCVNKWNLNQELADQIERQAARRGLPAAGRVRYDSAVTKAQVRRQSVVEYQAKGCADDIRIAWQQVAEVLLSDGHVHGPAIPSS